MAAFLSACRFSRCSARPMSSVLPEEALPPPLLLLLLPPERLASLSCRDKSSFQASNSAVTCSTEETRDNMMSHGDTSNNTTCQTPLAACVLINSNQWKILGRALNRNGIMLAISFFRCSLCVQLLWCYSTACYRACEKIWGSGRFVCSTPQQLTSRQVYQSEKI